MMHLPLVHSDQQQAQMDLQHQQDLQHQLLVYLVDLVQQQAVQQVAQQEPQFSQLR